MECKRHKWTCGWVCDRCGLRRADYEESKRASKPTESRMLEIYEYPQEVDWMEWHGWYMERILLICAMQYVCERMKKTT